MLEKYLRTKTKEKSTFSLAELKRKFPADKATITNYRFIGLIEPVNNEYPDTVRAHLYGD